MAVRYVYHYSTPPTVRDWILFILAFILLSTYFYISVRKINYFKSPITVCLGSSYIVHTMFIIKYSVVYSET